MTRAETSKRTNASFLYEPERRLLHAIAPRLPRWCTPDGLTAFGVFGCALVTLGGWLSRSDIAWLWLANLGLVIHWAGDSLDGTLARVRGIARPRYGFYLDQSIDTVGNLLIALGIGLAPTARLDLALLVLATYHMLAIQVCVRAIVDGGIHHAIGGLGPTEMRIAIIAMNTLVMAFGAPPLLTIAGRDVTWCDMLMLATAIGLIALFGFEMRRRLRELAREEPRG